MPSQQDVAKLAKVSFMTVSRVINNQPNVKPATREKVLKAIRELGYYPDAAAQALSTGKTKNIGVIFPHKEYTFSHPFLVELSITLEEQLNKSGYHLFLASNREDDEYTKPTFFFNEKKVDGLIIISPIKNDPIIKKLQKSQIPYIILNGRNNNNSFFVDSDNVQGTKLLIQHLFQLGHRKIGFVTGNILEQNANDRYQAYVNELKTRDINFNPQLVYKGNWSIISGYKGFNYLIKNNHNITAIIFSNDQMALGGIRAAHEKGIVIPDDISICGYDDTKYAKFSVPSLTTIHQSLNRLTETAVKMIVAQINGEKNIHNQIISSELKVRESSGKSPSKKY